jgi:thioredoxin 1
VVIDITDSDFEQKVIKSKNPVLLDMWAPWCVPCRMVAPVVDKLSQKYAGRCQFYKMNIDENQKTPSKYKVMSIPTLLLFKNGVAVDTVVGAVPERSLASRIDGIL